MTVQTIDLYENYNIPRNDVSGGYITVYARAESKEVKPRIRPAMLVIPGGGYSMLSDRESEPVALKYLDKGFTSFVLSYSVNAKYPTPLTEAMLAIRYIRENADKYGIDKNKVCAVGFSAGGHLAGLLATVKSDEARSVNKSMNDIMPNAVILSYPVVTMGEYTHNGTREVITSGDKTLYEKLSVEKRVDKNSRPAFIWHTCEDDCVAVENSLLLAEAYRRNKVPFALHVFEHGGHGLALCDGETNDFTAERRRLYDVGKWFELSIDWLNSRGIKVTVK